jgi:RNA polymerase sigma factor (sigma-70 family)
MMALMIESKEANLRRWERDAIYDQNVGMDREEEKRLFTRYRRTKDRKLLDQLIVVHAKFVMLHSYSWVRSGVKIPLLDFVQAGNIGLILAAERFDPERGIRFTTYARWWIYAEQMRLMKDMSGPVHMPSNFAVSDVPHKVSLADEPELTEDKSGPHRNTGGLSLEYVLSVDPLFEQSSSPEDIICQKEELERLHEAVDEYRKTCSERERDIIDSRFFQDEDDVVSIRQMGRKHGVSGARIGQIEEKIRGQLYTRLKEETV